MRTEWDPDLVRRYIEEEIDRLNIDCLITFDGHGVSGHLNHIAVSETSKLLLKSRPEL